MVLTTEMYFLTILKARVPGAGGLVSGEAASWLADSRLILVFCIQSSGVSSAFYKSTSPFGLSVVVPPTQP